MKNILKLLTNIKNAEKEDIIKIVRLYLSRWRIEEHFRGKKQEYDFENMRVRTLKAMNNLNMMLTIHLGYIAMLADKIDRKLLVIKIIEASKSLEKENNSMVISNIKRNKRNFKILSYRNKRMAKYENKDRNINNYN